MNENDINALLDFFVGGLDSTESANVTQKINSRPLWSKTYTQISRVFGSLDTVKDQNNQQKPPAGLASKTFQRILEQENAQQDNSVYIAQKETSSQTDQPTSRKRFTTIKPSFLALSACTGFLLVFVLAFATFSFHNQSGNNLNNTVVKANSSHNHPIAKSSANTAFCDNFAVTGAQQPSSSFFFCANNAPNEPTQVTFSNNNNSVVINSSQQPVNLIPSSISAMSEHNERMIKMACQDNVVVFSSQPNENPIIVVPQPHFPNELQNLQDVFNQSKTNFVVPVNYK